MNEKEIVLELQSQGLELAGMPCRAEDDVSVFYVPIRISRNSNGKQDPSNGFLKALAERFESQSIKLRFLLRHAESDRIEEGLRATILHSHISLVRNVFYSYGSEGGVLWIEPKAAPSQQQMTEIAERARSFADLFGLGAPDVRLTSQQILPRKLAILASLRSIAPADVEKIVSALDKRSLVVPSPDWLRRQLDMYRKSNDVIRLANGAYALTAKSLRALGTAKDKSSPDVARLLALARGAS